MPWASTSARTSASSRSPASLRNSAACTCAPARKATREAACRRSRQPGDDSGRSARMWSGLDIASDACAASPGSPAIWKPIRGRDRLPSHFTRTCAPRDATAGAMARGHRSLELQPHGLPHASARFQPHRKRQVEGRAVGLERGIRPVALILHLEHVTREGHRCANTRVDGMGDRTHAPERLVRGDEVRKYSLRHAAVHVVDPAWPAGTLTNRMERAESDAVLRERRPRLSVEHVGHGAVSGAGHLAAPDEIDVVVAADSLEREHEPVVRFVHANISNVRRDGVPVPVAHRAKHPPQDFAITKAHVSQEGAGRVEHHGERTSPEGDQINAQLPTPNSQIPNCQGGVLTRRLTGASLAAGTASRHRRAPEPSRASRRHRAV
jgi:GrpB-like predicted nucleotidyltransferase (UPF0157 family)